MSWNNFLSKNTCLVLKKFAQACARFTSISSAFKGGSRAASRNKLWRMIQTRVKSCFFKLSGTIINRIKDKKNYVCWKCHCNVPVGQQTIHVFLHAATVLIMIEVNRGYEGVSPVIPTLSHYIVHNNHTAPTFQWDRAVGMYWSWTAHWFLKPEIRHLRPCQMVSLEHRVL